VSVRPVVPRSYLYVPGDQPAKLAKAVGSGADALILDLEDAVAPRAKDAGRTAVRAFLESVNATGGSTALPQLWVRLNPGPDGLLDIQATWHPGLTGVMLAKTESVAELREVDRALARAEAAAGSGSGSTAVVPLLESGGAVLGAAEIARGPRVLRLQIGEADLTSELGLDAAGAVIEVLRVARAQVVLATAAAGLEPPVGSVSADFTDLAALRSSTLDLAAMGFIGRTCIHPAQIAVVNEVFTPDPIQLQSARDLVRRFDAAVAVGRGVIVDEHGMVDEAVARRARRLLALAGESST
jgi:citrate lyase subunit beta/citryl-CoA lyase